MSDSYWLFGAILTIYADEKASDSNYDLIEGKFFPGTTVPLHRHTAYSEQLYVLEGEFTIDLDGRSFVLTPGQQVFIPVGAAHRVFASGTSLARGLVVASPSGFARLIRETGASVASNPDAPITTEEDLALFFQKSAALGDEIISL